MKPDALRVCVLTDERLSRGRSVLETVAGALAGGCRAIQLRGKDWPGRRLYEAGRALRQPTREAGALLFVDDRLDVALAVEADGVHLGQDDLPLAAARSLAPRPFLIGVSAATPEEARDAEHAGADYLGVGSVFATATKADAGSPIGTAGLGAVARATRLPVVGIGGITAANAPQVIAAGAAGVAVVSAVVAARDIEAATRQLIGAVG